MDSYGPLRAIGFVALNEAGALPFQALRGELGDMDVSGFRLVRLSEFRARPTSWLWGQRIPCGAITLVEGDPGCGKSTLLYGIAARLSRGRRMPDCDDCPPCGGAILFQAEDPSNAYGRASLPRRRT